MFKNFLIVFLVFNLMLASFVLNYYQYRVEKLSMILVEEEENAHTSNKLLLGKIFEHPLNETQKFLLYFDKIKIARQNCYFSFHSIESGVFILPDYPPEA